ncbi:MAG: 30S ribosomal protein S20 [Candidatus Zambryskibacteria bacterium]|nr:30S ribosomal protein S20 [Candidatus Zambryskibacteria bacterium]
MPITSSAKKALRSSKRKRIFNLERKGKVTNAVKAFKKLVAAGDKKGATALMPAMQKALDKAVKGNTLKKNTASRKKSRLSKLLKKL